MKHDVKERRRDAHQKMLEHIREDSEQASQSQKRKAARAFRKSGVEVQGAVKSGTGRKKSKYGGRDRFNDFTLLPENIQDEARHFFIEGSTLEEITESINELHTPEQRADDFDSPPQGITLTAVQRYFRGNLELQRARIKRLQERGETLKRALAGEPDSAEAALADAVFYTGLMGMDRAGAQFRVKDAKQAFWSRQNMRLKQDSFRLKTLDSEVARKNVEVRTAHELKKLEHLDRKIEELKEAVTRETGSHELGPETMRKIREIYGLVAEPEVRPQPEL